MFEIFWLFDYFYLLDFLHPPKLEVFSILQNSLIFFWDLGFLIFENSSRSFALLRFLKVWFFKTLWFPINLVVWFSLIISNSYVFMLRYFLFVKILWSFKILWFVEILWIFWDFFYFITFFEISCSILFLWLNSFSIFFEVCWFLVIL